MATHMTFRAKTTRLRRMNFISSSDATQEGDCGRRRSVGRPWLGGDEATRPHMAASRARGCCSVAANGPIGPMRLLRPPTAEHQLSTGRLEELPAFVGLRRRLAARRSPSVIFVHFALPVCRSPTYCVLAPPLLLLLLSVAICGTRLNAYSPPAARRKTTSVNELILIIIIIIIMYYYGYYYYNNTKLRPLYGQR